MIIQFRKKPNLLAGMFDLYFGSCLRMLFFFCLPAADRDRDTASNLSSIGCDDVTIA
jgi:hypothetical protein